MDGWERSLFSRVAVDTGLRRRDLQTLTVSSFDLVKCTITVSYSWEAIYGLPNGTTDDRQSD